MAYIISLLQRNLWKNTLGELLVNRLDYISILIYNTNVIKLKGEYNQMANISNRQFVSAWLESVKRKDGIQGVAKKLGMATGSVYTKASYLRGQGVRLPKMPRPEAMDYSVDELNQFIEAKLA